MKSVRIEEVNFRWCEWISDQLVVATGLPELQDPGNKPGSQLADKECQDALPACKDETDNDCNDEQNAVACDIAEQRREGHKSREYIETENVDQNAEQLNTAHSKANVQGGRRMTNVIIPAMKASVPGRLSIPSVVLRTRKGLTLG